MSKIFSEWDIEEARRVLMSVTGVADGDAFVLAKILPLLAESIEDNMAPLRKRAERAERVVLAIVQAASQDAKARDRALEAAITLCAERCRDGDPNFN